MQFRDQLSCRSGDGKDGCALHAAAAFLTVRAREELASRCARSRLPCRYCCERASQPRRPTCTAAMICTAATAVALPVAMHQVAADILIVGLVREWWACSLRSCSLRCKYGVRGLARGVAEATRAGLGRGRTGLWAIVRGHNTRLRARRCGRSRSFKECARIFPCNGFPFPRIHGHPSRPGHPRPHHTGVPQHRPATRF